MLSKDSCLYAFSHINQKTQFENPVLEAKRKMSQDTTTPGQQGTPTPSGNTQEVELLWKPPILPSLLVVVFDLTSLIIR